MSKHAHGLPAPEGQPAERVRIDLTAGALVQREQQVYRITEALDFASVIGIEVESGRSTPLLIKDLTPVDFGDDSSQEASRQDLAAIADKSWQEAMERYRVIEPFVGDTVARREDVAARASEAGVSAATLYRWIERYRRRRLVTDLVKQRRGWQPGVSRLEPTANAVIEDVIETYYLVTEQRVSMQDVVDQVKVRCAQRGVTAPSAATVRRRLHRIDEKRRLRGRGQKELAKNRFGAVPGRFPNADYPLAVMQIDHTEANIILVDDAHRKPVGRPWLTLAMDVYSRTVAGYYLSFDAPSATSVAICVANAVLPKEEWLLLHKVEAEWPIWGFPATIHVDNGSDFRSATFERACLQYGINLEFRPVRQPRFGGHIERILGTFLKQINGLLGSTFSSVAEKGEYDAEKHASMTLSEFEQWFVAQATTLYHRRKHSKLGMTPLRQWEIGIFGNSDVDGIGMPPRPAGRQSVLLDFLPFFERTVQPSGVSVDNLSYYAEPVRRWIGATDPETDDKRKFIFRRDPRDISAVWFFDPEIKEYFKIPLAEQSLPSMSLWEFRQVKERLAAEGRTSVKEIEIGHALAKQRGRVEESKAKTKRARRQAQRRVEHEKVAPHLTLVQEPGSAPAANSATSATSALDDLLEGDVSDFGDFG